MFYHAYLPDLDRCLSILAEQMDAIEDSGLYIADEIRIGVCGVDGAYRMMSSMWQDRNKEVRGFKSDQGEYPTMKWLQEWLPDHRDWAVCYHHTKGISHPNDDYAPWRRCMQHHVIENWRKCVELLEHGADTVGAHWMTQEKYAVIPRGQRYWGGNFWWAKVEHLLKLPLLEPDSVNGKFFQGEAWIGKTKDHIVVRDLAPHWPQKGCT